MSVTFTVFQAVRKNDKYIRGILVWKYLAYPTWEVWANRMRRKGREHERNNGLRIILGIGRARRHFVVSSRVADNPDPSARSTINERNGTTLQEKSEKRSRKAWVWSWSLRVLSVLVNMRNLAGITKSKWGCLRNSYIQAWATTNKEILRVHSFEKKKKKNKKTFLRIFRKLCLHPSVVTKGDNHFWNRRDSLSSIKILWDLAFDRSRWKLTRKKVVKGKALVNLLRNIEQLFCW